MSWGDPRWYFSGTQNALDMLAAAEPDDRHVERPVEAGRPVLAGRHVRWLVGSNYVVWIPADKILFMEENQWNWAHARALYDMIERGESPLFELPAARVYRIDAADVAATQKEYAEDELEYQRGMEKPWEAKDAGQLRAQLLDGNHRALAAIAAGESFVPVIVGENYRQDVLPDEWVQPDAPRRAGKASKKKPAKKRGKKNPPLGDEGLRRDARELQLGQVDWDAHVARVLRTHGPLAVARLEALRAAEWATNHPRNVWHFWEQAPPRPLPGERWTKKDQANALLNAWRAHALALTLRLRPLLEAAQVDQAHPAIRARGLTTGPDYRWVAPGAAPSVGDVVVYVAGPHVGRVDIVSAKGASTNNYGMGRLPAKKGQRGARLGQVVNRLCRVGEQRATVGCPFVGGYGYQLIRLPRGLFAPEELPIFLPISSAKAVRQDEGCRVTYPHLTNPRPTIEEVQRRLGITDGAAPSRRAVIHSKSMRWVLSLFASRPGAPVVVEGAQKTTAHLARSGALVVEPLGGRRERIRLTPAGLEAVLGHLTNPGGQDEALRRAERRSSDWWQAGTSERERLLIEAVRSGQLIPPDGGFSSFVTEHGYGGDRIERARFFDGFLELAVWIPAVGTRRPMAAVTATWDRREHPRMWEQAQWVFNKTEVQEPWWASPSIQEYLRAVASGGSLPSSVAVPRLR